MDFKINPLSPGEVDLFYSNNGEGPNAGCIGYLRGDFGSGGDEFWHTWWEQQIDLKTPEFKHEFDVLISFLRQQGLLKNCGGMASYCHEHPEARIPGAWHAEIYGFRIRTDRYSYYIRCFPYCGDYNFYVYCYKNAERQREQTGNRQIRPVRKKEKQEPER